MQQQPNPNPTTYPLTKGGGVSTALTPYGVVGLGVRVRLAKGVRLKREQENLYISFF